MKKIFITLTVVIVSLVSCNLVLAEVPPMQTGGSQPGVQTGGSTPSPTASQPLTLLQNPLKAKNVKDLLLASVDLAIFIGIIVAVVMFIFIGFKFVTAQGNQAKLTEAKTWFLYAVIGTAVLISAKVIVDVIQNTLTSAGVVNENIFKKP